MAGVRRVVVGGAVAAGFVLLAGQMVSCGRASTARSSELGGAFVAGVSARAPVAAPAVGEGKPLEYAGIHNVVTFYDGFVSGSEPEGDAGFDTLVAMGVKTIISVDGAVPEVERARVRGIRYIHLPVGYNGFDEQRKLELVRATRDAMADGPVYIHCHHGKHRSAGAAAAIAASLGWGTPEAMVEKMKVSGTAPNYKGLYACAAEARPVNASVIDAVPANFVSVSRPSTFVGAMVEIDEVFEHLRAIEKAGWTTPADHPDLVPAAEAGRMVDLFRNLAAGDRAKGEPQDFLEFLLKDQAKAKAIEDLIVAGSTDGTKLSAEFKSLGSSCKECHAKHRD